MDKIQQKEYETYVKSVTPVHSLPKNMAKAFLVGGLICVLGQVLRTVFENMGLDKEAAGSAVSISLVFLGVALTACRLFEKIAKFAGAGTLVPITGFANSIAAPAMEFKTEGFVLGTCVKMFSIAGPVLTFGISASVFYGVILWLMEVMG